MRFISHFYWIFERKGYLDKVNNLPKHHGAGPPRGVAPMQLNRLKAGPGCLCWSQWRKKHLFCCFDMCKEAYGVNTLFISKAAIDRLGFFGSTDRNGRGTANNFCMTVWHLRLDWPLPCSLSKGRNFVRNAGCKHNMSTSCVLSGLSCLLWQNLYIWTVVPIWYPYLDSALIHINQMFRDKSKMPFKLYSILQCPEICTRTFQEVYKFYRYALSVMNMKMFFSKNRKNLLCGGRRCSSEKTCKLHDFLKELPLRFPNVKDLSVSLSRFRWLRARQRERLVQWRFWVTFNGNHGRAEDIEPAGSSPYTQR